MLYDYMDKDTEHRRRKKIHMALICEEAGFISYNSISFDNMDSFNDDLSLLKSFCMCLFVCLLRRSNDL